MNTEAILDTILKQTIEPYSGLALSLLPIKAKLNLDDNEVHLNLTAGFPSRFLQESLTATLTQSLQQYFPDKTIVLSIDHFIKAHRSQLAGKGLRGVKNTIAVASGKGGVGKSTVTVNLASALARAGARVGILDADIYGPSIPHMLGQAEPVQLSGDFYKPAIAHGIQAMSIGYLTQGEPALIWRGPMLAKSLIQMIEICQWDELDYLFIDLPPGTGDIQLTLVQKIPLTGAIIVTTPQNVATLDAEKALKMFAKTNIEVFGLIENMSLHHCKHCGQAEAIFGSGGAEALCKNYQSKLLGQLPLNPEIGLDCEKGTPTASVGNNDLAKSFIKAALASSIEIARRPLNYAEKFPSIVVE